MKEQSSGNLNDRGEHTAKNHQTFGKRNTKKDVLNTTHRRTYKGGNKLREELVQDFTKISICIILRRT